MKIATLIARILLGLLFLVFGLNGFLHFIPMPPPTGLAGQYMGALFLSHYLAVVFALEAVGGLLLLLNRYVPLALVLLGPVLVNIVLFHACLAPAGCRWLCSRWRSGWLCLPEYAEPLLDCWCRRLRKD